MAALGRLSPCPAQLGPGSSLAPRSQAGLRVSPDPLLKDHLTLPPAVLCPLLPTPAPRKSPLWPLAPANSSPQARSATREALLGLRALGFEEHLAFLIFFFLYLFIEEHLIRHLQNCAELAPVRAWELHVLVGVCAGCGGHTANLGACLLVGVSGFAALHFFGFSLRYFMCLGHAYCPQKFPGPGREPEPQQRQCRVLNPEAPRELPSITALQALPSSLQARWHFQTPLRSHSSGLCSRQREVSERSCHPLCLGPPVLRPLTSSQYGCGEPCPHTWSPSLHPCPFLPSGLGLCSAQGWGWGASAAPGLQHCPRQVRRFLEARQCPSRG